MGGLNSDSLANRPADFAVSALKVTLGSIPGVGPLLEELVTSIIPGQRIDRIAAYAKELGERFTAFEEQFLRKEMENEEFTDLMEEGLRQASRSLSEERRAYIASIIAKSLSSEEIEYQESKHLLRVLDELSDVEVIWLRSYCRSREDGGAEFRKTHEKALKRSRPYLGAPQDEIDKAALQGSYRNHLLQLGLLTVDYQVDARTRQPEFEANGAQKVKGHKVTSFGRLLLREIGLISGSAR